MLENIRQYYSNLDNPISTKLIVKIYYKGKLVCTHKHCYSKNIEISINLFNINPDDITTEILCDILYFFLNGIVLNKIILE